jgi:hypothetical protein
VVTAEPDRATMAHDVAVKGSCVWPIDYFVLRDCALKKESTGTTHPTNSTQLRRIPDRHESSVTRRHHCHHRCGSRPSDLPHGHARCRARSCRTRPGRPWKRSRAGSRSVKLSLVKMGCTKRGTVPAYRGPCWRSHRCGWPGRPWTRSHEPPPWGCWKRRVSAELFSGTTRG